MSPKKTVRIKLDDKFYDLVTDESEEELIAVVNSIRNLFSKIRIQNPDASTDEILVLMLANCMLNNTKFEKEMAQMANRLRNLIDKFYKEKRERA